MNTAHLHFMLNRVPVLGIAFWLGLLLFGVWKKSKELKNTALGLFVIVMLLAVPAYVTCEQAEDAVKPPPGVSKAIIELPEEAATVTFTGVIIVGLASLAGLLLFHRGKMVPIWFGYLMVAATLIVSGLMAWTADIGGQIRHTEIRSNASPPQVIGDQSQK